MSTPQGRLGRWGEDHARRHLEGKGYTISATNYRSRWSEVDIVARLGDEFVFVEVKPAGVRRSEHPKNQSPPPSPNA